MKIIVTVLIHFFLRRMKVGYIYRPQNNRKLWKPRIADLGYDSNRAFKSPVIQALSYGTGCAPSFCKRQNAIPEPDVCIVASHNLK